MCLAPQQRALFPHLNRTWCVSYIFTSKRASRHNGVHFFHISTSKSGPSMVCFFTLFTSKCASHHNSVHLFISHLASWLRTRRFSEPTFRPSGATKRWKNTMLRDFPTFRAPLSSDFLHLRSSPSLIFSLLTFSIAELLPGCAFPSIHIVGSLASKLPSTIRTYIHTNIHAYKKHTCKTLETSKQTDCRVLRDIPGSNSLFFSRNTSSIKHHTVV